MGRSPEILCAHSPAGPAAPRLMFVGWTSAPRRPQTGCVPRVAGRGWPGRRPCRSAAIAPAPGSRPAWRSASARWGRDACRRGRAAVARSAATQVQYAMRAVPPAGMLQAITQREHRIEHGADGARQRAAFEHGERRAQLAAASQEFRAIGFVLGFADGDAFDHGVMRGPNFRFVGRAAPAVARSARLLAREEFRAHEHLGKCRVRHVRGLRRRAPAPHSEVTSISRVAQRAIVDGQQPHLGIVLRATPALRAWWSCRRRCE